MKALKERAFAIYIVFTFVVMLIFYVQMHPDYMRSLDDWTYISYMRQAWPMKGEWNPGRVLPETLGGLIGNIAGIVVYPVYGDYVKSISATYGCFFALFVAIYIYSFGKMVKKLFGLDEARLTFIAFVFFFSHFQLTKVNLHNNNYLFRTGGLTSGIFYFVPELLCVILVFYLICAVVSNNYWTTKEMVVEEIRKKYIHYGVIFLLLYLADFSNLMVSGFIISFIGTVFFYRFFLDIKNKTFRKNSFLYLSYIVPLIMYFLCAVSETTGGRAGMFENRSFADIISDISEDLYVIKNGVNHTYLICAAGIVICSVILSFTKKSDAISVRFRLVLGLLLSSFVVNLVYLMLLSARLARYLSRASVYNSLLIWIVIIVSVSTAYLVRVVRDLLFLAPIISFILLFCIFNVPDNVGNCFGLGDRLYETNENNVIYYDDDNSMVQQFKDAEKSGKESLILYSKVYSGETGNRVALRIRRTLLRHGVITKEIEIESVQKID